MTRNRFSLITLVLLALAATAPSHAETLMVAQTGLFAGRQSFIVPLELGSPGELTVRLTDLGWLGALSDLSFSLSKTDGLLSQMATGLAQTSPGINVGGVQTYDIGSAGLYYGFVSGRATGPYNIGLYSLSIAFAADASVVPLPAAAWLLLSALGLMSGWTFLSRKREDELPAACMA